MAGEHGADERPDPAHGQHHPVGRCPLVQGVADDVREQDLGGAR